MSDPSPLQQYVQEAQNKPLGRVFRDDDVMYAVDKALAKIKSRVAADEWNVSQQPFYTQVESIAGWVQDREGRMLVIHIEYHPVVRNYDE